ncbi:MAG: hypothetical protein AAF357_15350, partial [Verrucomicrobiota bacterium]
SGMIRRKLSLLRPGFDPTNNRIPAHQHIKIAHGRDYFDVQPLKGIFVGSGGQALSVEVDVERF